MSTIPPVDKRLNLCQTRSNLFSDSSGFLLLHSSHGSFPFWGSCVTARLLGKKVGDRFLVFNRRHPNFGTHCWCLSFHPSQPTVSAPLVFYCRPTALSLALSSLLHGWEAFGYPHTLLQELLKIWETGPVCWRTPLCLLL